MCSSKKGNQGLLGERSHEQRHEEEKQEGYSGTMSSPFRWNIEFIGTMGKRGWAVRLD